MQKKVLGKGLDALFRPSGDGDGDARGTATKRIASIHLNDIIPNRHQPREEFSNEAMEELKASIRENGIIEPPIVRRTGDFYELIAGERRYRASRELGFDTIDVIVMEVATEEQALVLSLIENIQRENLNAIEEARAFRRIMETMHVTQEEVATIVGKSRSAIANTVRLLALADPVKDMVARGTIAAGSARALLAIDDRELQIKVARMIDAQGLSARKAEDLVRRTLSRPVERTPREPDIMLQSVREDLQRAVGTSVKISGDSAKGKIIIEYHSRDDLERVIETIKGTSFA